MDNLLFQTAFLGDLFLAIPLMREWRNWNPEQRLVLVCRKGLGEYFKSIVDEVIEVDKRDTRSWRSSQEQLLAREFNDVICPHPSFRSAWLVKRLRVHGRTVGFRRWWNVGMFDCRVDRPEHLPDALRQLSLLTALNSDFAEQFSQFAVRPDVDNRSLKGEMIDLGGLEIPSWAALSAKSSEERNSRRIMIAPGSVWATKRWTEEGFVYVAKTLVGRGYEIQLIGGLEEKELCERIAARIEGAESFAGVWKIPETVKQMTQTDLLIANDSGAIHMAAAAGLKTVAVFGPTTPAQGFRPWQSDAVIVQKELKCRPCGSHGHHSCPIGTHECMRGISPDRVLQAVHRLLESR